MSQQACGGLEPTTRSSRMSILHACVQAPHTQSKQLLRQCCHRRPSCAPQQPQQQPCTHRTGRIGHQTYPHLQKTHVKQTRLRRTQLDALVWCLMGFPSEPNNTEQTTAVLSQTASPILLRLSPPSDADPDGGSHRSTSPLTSCRRRSKRVSWATSCARILSSDSSAGSLQQRRRA